MATTEWFDADVKPPIKGVYEVDDDTSRSLMYAYWDGKQFGYRAGWARDAYDLRNNFTHLPRLTKWRGPVQDFTKG